jgi:hypothetical protein
MEKEKKIDLSALSAEDLEKELSRRKQEERENKRLSREKYEADRDSLVTELVLLASNLEGAMADFKKSCIKDLNTFRERALKYGDIRSNSKGGFLLRNSVTGEVVSLDRNTVPEYDERASLAEQLLKEFLQEKVKKKDLQAYRTVAALLEKNKKGDYTPGRIAALLKIRDNYPDEKWQKAMSLFEESFQVREISYSVSFYRKDAMGKDKALCLTFASLPVDEENNTEEK